MRLGVDIDPTQDPDRFSFQAQPRAGLAPRAGEDPAWRASGDVVRGEQGLKITRLEIEADPKTSAGITGSLVRQIPLGTLLDYVRAKIALAEVPVVANIKAQTPVAGGRTPMTDELLRQVASSYLVETAPGKPSGALKRMAEEFGRPEETIRTWISRARKAGWLGPSARGRAGAEPGPKFFEHALFVRVDGSERVLAAAGTRRYEELASSANWRRLPDDETERYKRQLAERGTKRNADK